MALSATVSPRYGGWFLVNVETPSGVHRPTFNGPVSVVGLQAVADGWMIEWTQENGGGGYVHLTAEWCDAMYQHQIQPNNVHNPAFNRLRYMMANSQGTTEEISEVFSEAYEQIIQTRQARASLGLKAVTRDGDEDLKAVQEGEPVRSHNAVDSNPELHEWIKEQRAKNR